MQESEITKFCQESISVRVNDIFIHLPFLLGAMNATRRIDDAAAQCAFSNVFIFDQFFYNKIVKNILLF